MFFRVCMRLVPSSCWSLMANSSTCWPTARRITSLRGSGGFKDDTVILDSKVTDAPPFRLLSSAAKRSPVVRVWIKGKNGSPVPNLDVVLKTTSGETTARTDQDGAAVFPAGGSPKSVMIQVRVYNLNAGPYPLNPAHNDFVFEINGEAITTVPFRGEILKVKG